MNKISDENDDDEKNNGRNESNSQNDNINNHDDKTMKPLEDNEIESVQFFVAVKFIDDKEKHHVIVTSDKVLKFDPVKTERKKYKNPYKVLKYDTDRQQEFAVPANILDHSDSLVDLKNPHKRYVYPKTRLSDALQKLAQESESEDDGLDTKDQIKKDRKDKVMRQKKNQTVPSNARKNVNKCDNMQMVDKQTQRELIKRKAQQLLKDNETVSSMKQMKMNTVSVNYKLDFPNNTQCDTGLVSENMDSQINTLNKKINALEEEIDEKNKEIDNLQLSLVLANSNIDALRIEVDEVYTLLESCTEKNNELKKKLEALESTNVDKSNTQGNVLESPVRSTVVSIKSKKLFDSPTMVQEEDSIPCTSSLTPPMKVNNKLLHRTPPTMFEGEENAVPSASSSTPMKVKENKSAVTTTPSLKGCTQKNSKKIKKYKWLKHTLYDYDSDDYASDLKTAGKEKNHEDFTAFQITNNDGHNEKMFHLCYGYCIKYEEWKSIRSQPTASRFINKLAIALWGEREMVLRAIDLRRAESRRDRDTPRKAVTPKKAGILRKCYRQYLLTKHEIKQKDLEKLNQNNLSKNHKKNLLKKLDGWTTHLSNAINQVYNQEKAKDKDDDSSPSSEDDKGSNRAVDLDSDN